MRHTPLLCAIAICLWSVVIAGGQATPSVSLSAALRTHIKAEHLGIVTSIRGTPLGVRDALQKLWGTPTLDIAEPDAEFRVTDAGNQNLPIRRLVTAGCSIDHCLVYYERGGSAHTWQVVLLHWTPAETRIEFGGSAPAGLKTVDDVRNAVLSGTIKGPNKVW